ncbi:MAG TPA: hypothetical protein VGD23_12995 [Sphingomicrobium sp.]
MNGLTVSILAAAMAIGPAALAKEQPNKQGADPLKQALGAVAAAADARGPKPPEYFNPKNNNGQGAEHANPRAILRVCSKDTPAAHRAAICEVGVSPD